MKRLIPIITLILLISNNCKQVEKADLIIINAKVYTIDSIFSINESIAIAGGKILATGTTDEIKKKYMADRIIDLKGKAVYPGFIDPHCHFYGYGTTLQEADLTGTNSYAEVLEILKTHAQEHPSEWITGRGWDQNDWPKTEFPDKKELDELFPDRPVLITRIDGHAALANQKALNMAQIDLDTKVEGGDILIKNGELTGILIDNTIEKVRKIIPAHGSSDIRKTLLDAQEKCFAVGLTSVHDAGLDSRIIEAIDSLHNEGDLKMRVYAMINPNEENFNHYLHKGPIKTERLNISCVKLFADGALGSRGARMTEAYRDDPENFGIFVSSSAYLKKMALKADSFNYQVATHCIGDEANRQVLKIYGEILKGKNDKRWRIEHAQVIHPEDYKLFEKFSIIPSIQATHATSDMYWADERLGSRIKDAYAYKKLLGMNGWLPNGSDFPVESINPIYGFFAAFARKDHEGYPETGFQMENALSREESLKSMTIWAAKAAFEENEKGSIEPGKYADFVILDRDIMTVPEMQVIEARVLGTFVGGEKVY